LKHYLGGGYKLSKILIGVSILVIIGTVIVGKITHAGFKSSISVPLANGHITYKHPDFSLVGLYVENDSGNYVEVSSVPTGSYEVNASKTYCTKPSDSDKVNDNNVTITYVNNSLTFGRVTSKNTKCYVYLDLIPVKTQLVSNILLKYTKNTSRSGQVTTAFKESTPTTVYSKQDNVGTSYVFAGENPNNWVKLGNLYFRIVRFNGDGSLRLIYSGEGSAEISGERTQLEYQTFNENVEGNHYLGLQYTSGQVHGVGINSTILGASNSTDTTTLYGWYNSKIKPSYASLIDTNAGFCSDRDNYTNNTGTTSGGGTGNTETYYRAYITYYKDSRSQTTYTPVLTCKNASDNLKLPVGLITADEYMLAGGGINDGFNFDNWNTKVWLHTGQSYWTMTPSWFIYDVARVFGVDSRGFISQDFVVSNMCGVRPVINLKSSTLFLDNGADGTSTNPYVVQI